jgi:beta-glucosidase
VKLIVERIRAKLPAVKILLLAVFPRDELPQSQFRKEVDDLNACISPLHDGKSVHYLNLASTFLNADGSLSKELFPDTLHLSAKAYEMWAEAMMPMLEKLIRAV